MELVKRGSDRYDIVEGSKMIAYIEKQRMGTHGHWRGYRHYPFCEMKNEFIWAGAYININGALKRWTEEPTIFLNLKDVKEHYERK